MQVLGDMTRASFEPSLALCNTLLDDSLLWADAKVLTTALVERYFVIIKSTLDRYCLQLLRVLASWYLDNFHIRLDRGITMRMLQVL